jgi:predicted metal-binding membrane protein
MQGASASLSTDLERSSRLDRSLLLALLCAMSVASWVFTFRMAEGMDSHHLHHPGFGPLFTMWAVMMVGMMIPSEVPVLLRLTRASREGLGRSPLAGTLLFLVGYLVPWTAFSLGAAVLQVVLEVEGLLDHHMATTSRGLAAALLLAAGAVQLSPLKRACLDRCQKPRAPARGTWPPFAAGMSHATLSIASCGLLMLILFTTGVMNLASMTLLTVLLVTEKVAPPSFRLPTSIGALLVALGVFAFLR